jgi:hypothetical protein
MMDRAWCPPFLCTIIAAEPVLARLIYTAKGMGGAKELARRPKSWTTPH